MALLAAIAGFVLSACIAMAQLNKFESLELCLEANRLDVVQPWNAAYESLRRVSSKMWSTYPLSIVLPTSEEEILDTLECARRFGARVTARGGGHSNAGGSVMNGGC
jgi:FAD/FMN-containing dehydrogenase